MFKSANCRLFCSRRQIKDFLNGMRRRNILIEELIFVFPIDKTGSSCYAEIKIQGSVRVRAANQLWRRFVTQTRLCGFSRIDTVPQAKEMIRRWTPQTAAPGNTAEHSPRYSWQYFQRSSAVSSQRTVSCRRCSSVRSGSCAQFCIWGSSSCGESPWSAG